ncbi:MAG TPA: hypothetical protein VJS42_20385 [Steroidobacteraceae bacterium]|nr:hypothetical protein [Steroidobacteraceae bacterium]
MSLACRWSNNGYGGIEAHDNVRKRLESGSSAGTGGAMKSDMPAQPRQALPILTFDHSMTVHLNGEDIRALHFESGHTDGDSIVFFSRSNVVHMGDDFVTYGFPFIETLYNDLTGKKAGKLLQHCCGSCAFRYRPHP